MVYACSMKEDIQQVGHMIYSQKIFSLISYPYVVMNLYSTQPSFHESLFHCWGICVIVQVLPSVTANTLYDTYFMISMHDMYKNVVFTTTVEPRFVDIP